MLRIIFTFILSIHGLIHIMGFVKEFGLAKIEGITGKTLIPFSAEWGKTVGLLWLLTCLLLIASTIIYLIKKEWWVMASAGVLLSQVLIILYWHDAKVGTVANIIVLIGIILSYASWNFQTKLKQELHSFLPKNHQSSQVVTSDMITGLPPVVQKWLFRSNTIGKEMPYKVYLKQKGMMRTKPDGNWMSLKAEEYFTIPKPGFLWIADVQAAPYLNLYGRDKYENGKGQMLIKVLSLFPVADAKGKEIDQGTLLRYLGEIVWFPSAALSTYILWQQIDDTRAMATMTYGGISTSGTFTFTSEGDIVSFEAHRYFDRKEGATLEKWVITIEENGYKEFEGIRIPAKSNVTWKLKEGDFTWFMLEITDIDYNLQTQPSEVLLAN